MQVLLNILLLLVGTADAVVFFQVRKHINSWGDHLDEPLSDEDHSYVQGRLKLIGVLSVIGTVLLTVRVIVYELIPLVLG